ncbi:conserved Plasmodium protein, unknown function [Plasmodium knowlesi strain H]|uniref:HTH OST-type domain-containing protein n=3 Tax=Plasmodium knowlesi TaxID=5850 RepID=A0A1A7VC18_PLAKH|nr:OST-HTH associated domain protein, putative [Plasmodium knowlesi strain H]OTN67607.1 Uncharacterized protein PKNOH_S05372100 [Plasmodium knowlesi]CAA9990311.1 OST-HTH associated domain protein, putative [Plasmodium knowlesi strain H]SBO19517.1 conserved Plasmodium protein, unknown function [Plasmodium knowlesi strain H]SBO22803.1 conserved Plasmodium protein, unknown function [Plasmodium knowlesi strain H]VVS79785.1 OST-HTH associated domain protein, putative [Plasmodium knowlesi strain H]
MGYAHNNRRRNKNLSCSDVGYYLKGKGSLRNCKENNPVELYDQNIHYGGVFHTHNDVLRGGQGMGYFNRRIKNTYNYCRDDVVRENVGEVNYVFYEPLRYPAFKMADRNNRGGPENSVAEKDDAESNERDTSEEDKVVSSVDYPNEQSCGESMTTMNLTRVRKMKKEGECSSGKFHHGENAQVAMKVKKQRSRKNKLEVRVDDHSGDECTQVKNLPGGRKIQKEAKQVDGKRKDHLNTNSTMDSQMSTRLSDGECELPPIEGKRGKTNLFIPITAPRVHRHPSQITNEVKFILHMTILTLYKDQVKPSYKKIKQRLQSFHQNEELKNHFLEICLFLQNEYLVVKSRRNNIFVLLRETPKWFSGWIKTRSFTNPYPEIMWRKFARHLWHVCRAGSWGGPTSSQGHLTLQFAKHLCRKGYLFFQGLDTLLGEHSYLYSGSTYHATSPSTLLHPEHAEYNRQLFTFNLLHDSFSYFSSVNDSAVRIVQSSFVSLYHSILDEDGNRAGSSRTRSSHSSCTESTRLGSAFMESVSIESVSIESVSMESSHVQSSCRDSPGALEPPPWELGIDIYRAADALKNKALPFFRDYSIGKIAHVVQLGLYGGLLHEEGQVIKPACCSRTMAASVWGQASQGDKSNGQMGGQTCHQLSNQMHNQMDEKMVEQMGNYVTGQMSGEEDYPHWSDLLTEQHTLMMNCDFLERQGPHMEQTHMEQMIEGKCGGVPVVPTAEEAKAKIYQLLKGSREKIIFFCSLKDLFFKKFEEVLNPLHFGYTSLIEFLFFQCQEVCKLLLLNRNIILVHPSCDEQSLMDMIRQEEDDDDDDCYYTNGDMDGNMNKNMNGNMNKNMNGNMNKNMNGNMNGHENIIEQFDYAQYISTVSYSQKKNLTQQESLQIYAAFKDLGGNRKKDNFFITFSFWKYVTGKEKKNTR